MPESIFDPTLDSQVTNYTTAVYGSPSPVCSPAQPCPGGLIFNGPVDQVIDKQIAIFGDVNFKITDTFKATVGLRLSKLDYSGSVWQTGPFLGTTLVQQSSNSEKPVTPKAVLSWQPDRDNLLYVSGSKGFPARRTEHRRGRYLQRQSRCPGHFPGAREVLFGQPVEL